MMKNLKLIICWCLLLLCNILFAQNPITGKVTDQNKKPLAGVTVTNSKTKKATITNSQGDYTIQAAPGDEIVFTSIGFGSRTITAGSGVTSFSLLPEKSTELDEVVVAMDIKRKPRELGYSVQTVSGKDIQESQRQNFINSLQGRVAGLTVTPTTGAAGSSSTIVLRGFNSMSLSNQPLFIIDGIIMDNQTIDENANGGGGLGLASDRPNRNSDYTNRAADINPNDIESVTVLKGPEATALYGSQASSGAIVITTKKAKTNGKVDVNYDDNFRAQRITRFASINNDYNQGSNGVAYVPPTTSFNYFGPAYAPGTQKYDNKSNFFNTGFAQTHNISADLGVKDVGFRFSGSFFDEHGAVPRNTYQKTSLRLSNTTKVNKYIDFSPSITYTNAINDKPIRGGGGYLLDLYAYPSNVDVRNYQDANGNKTLLYSNAYNTDPIDNPLWSANNNHGQDKTDRYITSLGVNIHPFDWLNVAGRFGYDTYKTTGYTFYHPESSLLSLATGGGLDNYTRKYHGYNHTITATANKKVGDFTARVMVGTMWQDYETEMFAIYGTNLIDSISPTTGAMYKGGSVVTSFNPNDSNITRYNTRLRLQQNNFGRFNQSIIREQAYFGEVAVNYKDFAYISYTHRFESSSTLPQANRNYNYPGVSLSLIMSDIIPTIKSGKIINYWKLRGSSASTARLNDPYSNQSYFTNNFSSNNINGGAYSYYFTNNNPNLTPEKQRTYEIGTELKFFHNAISLEAAYYHTLSENQIAQNFRASYATGFVLNTQNAATTRNQGFELSLTATPVNKKDFGWNIIFNFNHTWSKVLDLPASIDPALDYYNSDTWLYGNARGGLIRGNPTTAITAYGYARNNAGAILIDPATGIPKVDATFLVRGDRNPKFTLGTTNQFRYKNWNLSFLWDLKVGGDIFNATDMYLTLIGKGSRTSDRFTPRVVNGVLADGFQNSSPTKNTISVIPGYVNSFYTTMPEEEFIQKNVNWLRLRDLTLTYMVPKSNIGVMHTFKSLGFFVTCNDLILITNYTGADPAVNGTTAGTRGVGAFGFDYGNLATPLGVSIGLRAGF